MTAADHYLADRVLTASPAQLTALLYDGAAAAVRGTARLQEAGDHRGALARSLKAQRILLELRGSLDHGAGGQLAGDLDRLYSWCHSELVRATNGRDSAAVKTVLTVVEELGGAWREGCLGVPQPA